MRDLAVGWLGCGLLVLSACASQEWVHPYKTSAALDDDRGRCLTKVQQSQEYRMLNGSPYIERGLMERCLRQEGWVLRAKNQ